MTKFIVSVYSIGHIYLNAVISERDKDRKRKNSNVIRYSGLHDNIPDESTWGKNPYNKLDTMDDDSPEEFVDDL